jgi:glucose-1-phosphate cytidylyltransferase
VLDLTVWTGGGFLERVDVVILCGGRGTRSYPFTEYFPKVMMPINGTPILVHLMRIYAEQGFTRFILAAGYRKEMLIDYFDGRFPDWKVDIVDTGEDVDTGERIARCSSLVGQHFFATYGDGLGDLDLSKLLAEHRGAGALATLTTVPLRSQYGMLVFDSAGRVERFEEKPVIRNYWINAGFFVFNRAVFDSWEGTNLERDVLPALARKRQLGVYQHEGFWKSMDTSKDQQEMENLCLNGSPPWKLLRPTAVGVGGE